MWRYVAGRVVPFSCSTIDTAPQTVNFHCFSSAGFEDIDVFNRLMHTSLRFSPEYVTFTGELRLYNN
jgi:hypothetical protein